MNITVAVVLALASIAAHATAAATRHRVASTDGHGRRRVQDTGFRDVSCSGAAIADLTRPQLTSHGTNPPRPRRFRRRPGWSPSASAATTSASASAR